jgi:hypothetical protein
MNNINLPCEDEDIHQDVPNDYENKNLVWWN